MSLALSTVKVEAPFSPGLSLRPSLSLVEPDAQAKLKGALKKIAPTATKNSFFVAVGAISFQRPFVEPGVGGPVQEASAAGSSHHRGNNRLFSQVSDEAARRNFRQKRPIAVTSARS